MKRTEITIKKLKEMLKKRQLTWVERGFYLDIDILAPAGSVYITLHPPVNGAVIEREENRCLVNTDAELFVVSGVSEKEYDYLFSLYGWGRVEY